METLKADYEEQIENLKKLVKGDASEVAMISMEMEQGKISRMEEQFQARLARMEAEKDMVCTPSLLRFISSCLALHSAVCRCFSCMCVCVCCVCACVDQKG